MAIHCMNPNTISADAEALWSLTNTEGRNLIDSFSNTITNLKAHWYGSDATKNINDLIKVYNGLADLLKTVQNLVVTANNTSILGVQREIVASGGSCTVGSELSNTLANVEMLATMADSTEYKALDAIVTDAEIFSSFPESFATFISNFNDAKDILMNNWLEGAGRDTVISKFTEFNGSVDEFKNILNLVRDNINTVAANKKTVF